jgi:hypothetical protein
MKKTRHQKSLDTVPLKEKQLRERGCFYGMGGVGVGGGSWGWVV